MYSVMQDTVNIANDINGVMRNLAVLNTYNEGEFASLFALLQSENSSDKQGTLDQKRTEIEPLRSMFE